MARKKKETSGKFNFMQNASDEMLNDISQRTKRCIEGWDELIRLKEKIIQVYEKERNYHIQELIRLDISIDTYTKDINSYKEMKEYDLMRKAHCEIILNERK